MIVRFPLRRRSWVLCVFSLPLAFWALGSGTATASERPPGEARPSGGRVRGDTHHDRSSVVPETVQGPRLLFLGWDKELTGTDGLGFSSMVEAVIAAGYEIEEDRTPARPITLERLQEFDGVAFGGLPESMLLPAEAQAFRAYVREGGGLFLGGQWGGYDPESQFNCNEIGIRFGITFNEDLVCDPTNHLDYDGWCDTSPGDPDNGREYPLLSNVASHPIGDGVTTVMLNWGQSLSGGTIVIEGDEDTWSDLGAELVDPKPDDCSDPWFVNEHDPGEPQGFPAALVATEVQSGKVVAVGDVDFWWNFAFDWYSHRQLLANILQWLSTPGVCQYFSLTPNTPVHAVSLEPFLCTFDVSEAAWGGIGAARGWGVGVYDAGQEDFDCVTRLQAESRALDRVNFVVGDFHRNELREYYGRVENLDAAGEHRTEWDDGSGTLQTHEGGSPGQRGIPTTRGPSTDWVLDVYDVYLEAGTSYGFNLESNGDVQMLLFSSQGETYWAGRDEAVWDSWFSGTYTASATGVHGLVLVNESTGGAGYSVLVRESAPLPVAVRFAATIEGQRPKVTWELEGAIAEGSLSLWRWDVATSNGPIRHAGTGERLEWITDPSGEYVDGNAQPEKVYAYALVSGEGLGETILAEASIAVPSAWEAVLGPVVPNPFNPSTQVYYEVPPGSRATIEVLDLAGRRLRVLLDGAAPSVPFVSWDGTDTAGRRVASGVYFVRMTATMPDGRSVRDGTRVVLLK